MMLTLSALRISGRFGSWVRHSVLHKEEEEENGCFGFGMGRKELGWEWELGSEIDSTSGAKWL